jgi:hypothetical protein
VVASSGGAVCIFRKKNRKLLHHACHADFVAREECACLRALLNHDPGYSASIVG